MKRILVIDHNPDNLVSIKALIAELFHGFTTLTATTGNEGIELAKTGQPDVILLESLMPVMDGFEVCKILKEDENLRDIPVVFLMAANESKENKVRAIKAGADGFLTKPVDEQELVVHINAMIKIKEANDFKKSEKHRLELLVSDRTTELQVELKKNLELSDGLRRNEELFRMAQEISPDGFTILHPLKDEKGEVFDFTWKYENHAIAQINGTDPAEVPGKRLLELFPAHQGTALFDAYIRAATDAEQQIFDEVYVGEIVSIPTWLRIVVVPMGDDIVILAQNITQRKTAEDLLRKSHARLNKVLEVETVGVMFWDLSSGCMTDANDTFLNMMGYSREELESRSLTWQNLTPPEYKKVSLAEIKKFQTTGRVGPYEKEYLRKDGTRLWMVFAGSSLEDNTCVEFCVDISDRKRADEKLRVSELLFRKIFEDSATGMTMIGKDLKFIKANRNFCQMIGYTESELQQLTFTQITHPDDIEIGAEEVKKMLAGESNVYYTEKRYIRKDGQTIWAQLSVSPIYDSVGKWLYNVANVVDITERKQAEKALQQAGDILENMQMGLYVYELENPEDDHTLCLVAANPASGKLSGVQPENLIGKYIDEIFPGLRALGIPKRFADVVRTGKSGEFEDFYYADDRLLEAAYSVKAFPLPNQRVGITFDNITERKLSEERLKESEERFLLAMKASNDGLFDWNLVTNEIYYSPGWKKMLGFEDHELPNDFSVWETTTDPEDVKKSWELQQKLINKQIDRFVLEFKMKHKDGHWVEILSRAEAFFDNTGKAVRIVGTHTDISEQKQAEAEVIKAKEKLEETNANVTAIIEGTADSIWAFDRNYNIVYINHVFQKDFHASFGVWLEKGSNLLESLPEFLQPFWKPRYDKVLSNEQFTIIDEVDTAVGKLYIQVTFNPIFKDGMVIGGSCFGSNITERKQAEKAIKESEERYRKLVSTVPDLIVLTDLDGNITFINDIPLPSLKHLPKVALLGQNMLSFIAEEDLPQAIENTHLMFERKLGPKEYRLKTEDGTVINSEVNGDIIYDANNLPAGMVYTIRDITERKKAEADLRMSEERFKSIVAVSNTGAWEYHHDKDFLWCSREYFTMLGRNPEDFLMDGSANIAETWINLLHPDDRQRASQHFASYIAGGSAGIYENYFRMHHSNGGWVWIWSRGQTLRDSDGKLTSRTLGTHIDITERKEFEKEIIAAKEKAEESDRLKSAFLANMSHEIRTPMNGIFGFAELLREPGLTGEEQQRYIALINRSGQRMLNIINDIVDISKIEAGLMELHLTESNINEQIEYIYTFFKPETESKGIQFTVKNSLSGDEASLKTDREKLYAILTNLVKNAVKYTPRGAIELGCAHKGQCIEFYVKDTGIGIPKSRQKAVFERFVQADIEDKMARQGAGLGLAITKAYIEMMGGSIWVESEEGKGSVFYFTLPCSTRHVTKINDHHPANADNKLEIRKLKILVVEDDEISELLLDKTIKSLSRSILIARTGIEAVEIVQHQTDIDLILMDIRLPHTDGYEATRRIRKFNKDVVIIAQTAYGLTGNRQMALDAGCDDYIAKPISKDDLLTMIQKYFA